jgi:hypothetical protein
MCSRSPASSGSLSPDTSRVNGRNNAQASNHSSRLPYMRGTSEQAPSLRLAETRSHDRGSNTKRGRSAQEDGVLVHIDDYRLRNQLQRPPSMTAYCLASGLVGTTAATALSLTVRNPEAVLICRKL